MARQIIVVRGDTSSVAGKIRFQCAFWLPRTPGNVTWKPAQTTSMVPDATPAELAALANGTIYEEAYTSRYYPIVPGMADARAEVIAAYTARLEALTNEEDLSEQFGGWSWNGTAWSAPAPFTPPAAAPSSLAARRFSAQNGTGGVAHGTAITTTPPLILHNPAGSGVILKVIESRFSRVSGTLGAGTVVYASNAQPGAPSPVGTTLSTPSALLGYSATSAGKAYQGGTLAALPTLVRPGIAVNGNPSGVQLVRDCVEGTLDVMPGNALSVCFVGTAGTSPLVIFGLVWEEAPV